MYELTHAENPEILWESIIIAAGDILQSSIAKAASWLYLIVHALSRNLCTGFSEPQKLHDPLQWQLLRTWVHEGISERVVALGNTFTSVQDVRQNTLTANNTIADLLFLYRCWHMWSTHRHARLIMCIPLVFIFVTTLLGCLVSLHKIDTRIVYISALITNTLLLGLTERTPAGRILWKGRQESLVMDCRVRIPQKHNTTVEIILESTLLYLICNLIYVIAFGIEKPYSAFGLICWGSLGQLVNIIPMIIIVRAAVVKNLGTSDTHTYHGTKLGTAAGISPVECLECTSRARTRMDV
ncbi:hypothetical protein B0H14DRAFT_2590393 [Mycena olivaceomarginata]|nr:hypothetical protein B0H14DRAFT_2590393 [Mycena olivaceomarginata]